MQKAKTMTVRNDTTFTLNPNDQDDFDFLMEKATDLLEATVILETDNRTSHICPIVSFDGDPDELRIVIAFNPAFISNLDSIEESETLKNAKLIMQLAG